MITHKEDLHIDQIERRISDWSVDDAKAAQILDRVRANKKYAGLLEYDLEEAIVDEILHEDA